METKINVLSFGMVNAYLIQGEKNILVDSGPAGKYKKLEEKSECMRYWNERY